MASYTITTDASQEAILTWIVAQYNRDQDLQLTNAEFVTLRFPQLLTPYIAAYSDYLEGLLKANFSKADPKTQAQVFGLLGIA